VSSTDRQSLMLRTQEIISSSPDGITAREAYKRALVERFGTDMDALLEHTSSLASGMLSGIRKRTYELPSEDTQLPLNLPQVIGIRTEHGDLLVHRDHADLGQVRQWVREARQHHSTQRLRFDRFEQQLDLVKDEPDALPWWSAKALALSIEVGRPDGE